ncbi:MAG TPA: hypothetical protein GXX65_03950 [Methanosarcina sp.]|nr:hypothetical protein [Methanosarcina sp.]
MINRRNVGDKAFKSISYTATVAPVDHADMSFFSFDQTFLKRFAVDHSV